MATTSTTHYTEIKITFSDFISLIGNIPMNNWIGELVRLVSGGVDINISQRKQIIDFI